MRYFIAYDGYGDLVLFREDPARPHLPYEVLRKRGNEEAWDMFVVGRFPVEEEREDRTGDKRLILSRRGNEEAWELLVRARFPQVQGTEDA